MYSAVFTLFLAASALALPTTTPSQADDSSLVKRATYASGKGMKTGKLSSSLSYQSSGVLRSGCSSAAKISNCYTMALAKSGNLERRDTPSNSTLFEDDDSLFDGHSYDSDSLAAMQEGPLDDDEAESISDLLFEESASTSLVKRGSARQRIELYSIPQAPSGARYTYTWKSYLAPTTGTTGVFFHLFQLIRRDSGGGPIITLDAKGGKALIMDTVRGCNSCKSVSIKSFAGRTIQNTLVVRYGSSGTLSYKAVDISSKKTLLSYSAKGQMGSNGAVKFGLYRGMPATTAATAYVGDYKVKKG